MKQADRCKRGHLFAGKNLRIRIMHGRYRIRICKTCHAYLQSLYRAGKRVQDDNVRIKQAEPLDVRGCAP